MKKNITVILSHPFYQNSNANLSIVKELEKHENVSIRHIDKLYPDGKINVVAEQEALTKADVVIFQFPMFWFTAPASLKNWVDSVFTYGFAYGSTGKALHNKEFLISTTVGSNEKSYKIKTVEKLFYNLTALGEYTGMKVLPIKAVFEMSLKQGKEDDIIRIKNTAKEHVGNILKIINT